MLPVCRTVFGGCRLRKQPLCFKSLEQAAQISAIQIQLIGQLGGRNAAAVRDLVHHAHLGQRVRAIQKPLRKHPYTPGVVTIEGSYTGNLLSGDGHDGRTGNHVGCG